MRYSLKQLEKRRQQHSYTTISTHKYSKTSACVAQTYQTLIEMSIIDSNDFYDYPTHFPLHPRSKPVYTTDLKFQIYQFLFDVNW